MKVSSLFHVGRFEPTAQNPKRERERETERESAEPWFWESVYGLGLRVYGFRFSV